MRVPAIFCRSPAAPRTCNKKSKNLWRLVSGQEKALDLFLVTIGTSGVGKSAAGLLLNVALNQIPVVVLVAHLLAINTDRDHFLESPDFSRVLQDALGCAQTHPDG